MEQDQGLDEDLAPEADVGKLSMTQIGQEWSASTDNEALFSNL